MKGIAKFNTGLLKIFLLSSESTKDKCVTDNKSTSHASVILVWQQLSMLGFLL